MMKTRDSCFAHAGMDLKASSAAMDALVRIGVSMIPAAEVEVCSWLGRPSVPLLQ